MSVRKLTTRGGQVAIVLWLAGSYLSAAPPEASDLRLVDAVRQGDSKRAQLLLAERIDVNQAHGDGMTALHWAAYNNAHELARLLIEAGARVSQTTRLEALTPMLMAASNGSADMMRLLLDAGADVNAPSALGATPLMKAAWSGNVDGVQLLVDRHADVNAREPVREQTPLMFASAANASAAIKILAAAGAELNATGAVTRIAKPRMDEDGNPLPPNAESSRIGTGGTIGAIARNAPKVMGGFGALHYAARDGKAAAVRSLIEAGANVNLATAGDGSSPLVVAISNGYFDVAQYLLDHGADPNLTNIDGLAALYAVIEAQWPPAIATPRPITAQETVSYLQLMTALLAHDAHPNARINKPLWFSPLHANSWWVKPIGATPFWRAAQATDLAAMKLLVAYGADPKLASTPEDTALHVAAGIGWAGNFSTNVPDGFMPSVKYLVEEIGLDVNAVDSQGYTPVMGAAWRGDNDLVQYLVSHGADLSVRSGQNWVVTDFANGPSLRSSVPLAHPDTIALLRKLGAPELTQVDDEEILGIIKRKIPDTTKDPKKKVGG